MESTLNDCDKAIKLIADVWARQPRKAARKVRASALISEGFAGGGCPLGGFGGVPSGLSSRLSVLGFCRLASKGYPIPKPDLSAINLLQPE